MFPLPLFNHIHFSYYLNLLYVILTRSWWIFVYLNIIDSSCQQKYELNGYSWKRDASKSNEPEHDKMSKMTCAPSEDSHQPGHPPSLIRVFAICLKKPGVLSYPLSTQGRLIKLGWSESSLGAHHFIGFVMLWLRSFAILNCPYNLTI